MSRLSGFSCRVSGLFVALTLLLAVPASAGKPASQPAFHLDREAVTYMANPDAPSWCLNEDDSDWREYLGWLNGSVSSSFYLCDPAVDFSGGMYWGPGGLGVFSDLYFQGSLTDMKIIAPDGAVRHGELVGSSVSGHGANAVTTWHYQACVTPPFYVSTNTGTDPIQGGTWTVSISGSFTLTDWQPQVLMSYVSVQQRLCPVDQANLRP